MAENAYPMPSFHFSVDLGGTIINCSEVSGLDIELDVIEYRDGNSQTFSKQKMSGLRKSSDVTVKKGLFKDDKQYYTWFNAVQMHVPERKDVTISLLDEAHAPVMTWKLLNAWPKKISSPSMKSDSSEVAIETIEIAHEGCTIE
ncbi:MAG: phage tail protein [Bacteroidetes bacterium]|jgi:phage tail-like protein|nr:phage tail protein [Bacteroidota bacterium]